MQDTTLQTTNNKNNLTEMAGGEEEAREQMAILLKLHNVQVEEESPEQHKNNKSNDLNFGKFSFLISLTSTTKNEIENSKFFSTQTILSFMKECVRCTIILRN
mgnify:CR=1 FL=1